MEHIAEEYAAIQEMTISYEKNSCHKEESTKVSDHISDNIFNDIKKFQHEEYQYLNLLKNILENGFWEEGRNGKTKSILDNLCGLL